MSWMYVIVAGLFETFGIGTIKRFTEKKNIRSLLLLIVVYSGSFLFLTLALRQLSLGVAYAVWTGIGIASGAILGIIAYGESKNPMRLFCIFLVIVAVVGLKLVS